jgi:hypothetical protein
MDMSSNSDMTIKKSMTVVSNYTNDTPIPGSMVVGHNLGMFIKYSY